MTDTLTRLADVAREVFRAPGATITAVTTADDVDGWDSLNHALFLLALERAFSIRFDPEDVIDLQDVGELVALVDRLRQG
jgi:acyl carrier protein